MRERPAGLKVEAEEPVKRRTLENVVQAVQVKKETWFRKGNKKERKYSQRQRTQSLQTLAVYLPCTCCSVKVRRGEVKT